MVAVSYSGGLGSYRPWDGGDITPVRSEGEVINEPRA